MTSTVPPVTKLPPMYTAADWFWLIFGIALIVISVAMVIFIKTELIPYDKPVGPAWIVPVGFFAAGVSLVQYSRLINPSGEPWKF